MHVHLFIDPLGKMGLPWDLGLSGGVKRRILGGVLTQNHDFGHRTMSRDGVPPFVPTF